MVDRGVLWQETSAPINHQGTSDTDTGGPVWVPSSDGLCTSCPNHRAGSVPPTKREERDNNRSDPLLTFVFQTLRHHFLRHEFPSLQHRCWAELVRSVNRKEGKPAPEPKRVWARFLPCLFYTFIEICRLHERRDSVGF